MLGCRSRFVRRRLVENLPFRGDVLVGLSRLLSFVKTKLYDFAKMVHGIGDRLKSALLIKALTYAVCFLGSQLSPVRTIDLVMSRLDEEAQKAQLRGQNQLPNDDLYYDGPKA